MDFKAHYKRPHTDPEDEMWQDFEFKGSCEYEAIEYAFKYAKGNCTKNSLCLMNNETGEMYIIDGVAVPCWIEKVKIKPSGTIPSHIIQIFDIDTNELLMEESITVDDIEEAEQYSKNLIEDNFDFEDVYSQIN